MDCIRKNAMDDKLLQLNLARRVHLVGSVDDIVLMVIGELLNEVEVYR